MKDKKIDRTFDYDAVEALTINILDVDMFYGLCGVLAEDTIVYPDWEPLALWGISFEYYYQMDDFVQYGDFTGY